MTKTNDDREVTDVVGVRVTAVRGSRTARAHHDAASTAGRPCCSWTVCDTNKADILVAVSGSQRRREGGGFSL